MTSPRRGSDGPRGNRGAGHGGGPARSGGPRGGAGGRSGAPRGAGGERRARPDSGDDQGPRRDGHKNIPSRDARSGARGTRFGGGPPRSGGARGVAGERKPAGD